MCQQASGFNTFHLQSATLLFPNKSQYQHSDTDRMLFNDLHLDNSLIDVIRLLLAACEMFYTA